jgi:serine/threonine protein kinase/Tfp pilus assembly protein PilF
VDVSGAGERTIFDAARRIEAPEDRRVYLEQACGQDRDLRALVEALLRVHEQDSDFLRTPAEGIPAGFAGPAPDEGPGAAVGPYRLVQQLGEGGMGTVYLAEQQEPVKRLVALKVIRHGMDSRQVVARFEAERQALALMDHPNIARVYDAGTTRAGRPYVVMELVRGVPITRYCDEHRLTPRQRLELFVPVCTAVQHAHQKGVIHRDLKPSNILVTIHDGKPVPKIIDFGVAKATGPKLTQRTLFTEVGSLIGTPEYMSPEQAELNNLDVDTRSDVYSLGVLLYELLTGATPLQRGRAREANLLELLRLIREEEPPRPSARLSTAEGLPAIAADRGLEPGRLAGMLRGDLDWIVLKCLEKDRSRRYETAGGLARDVERYLHDEPVGASPPSAWHRLWKVMKRNKGRVGAAALVLLALLAGMAGTTWGMIRAERAREVAVSAQLAEAERAEEAQKRLGQIEKGAEILASVFQDLDPKAEEQQEVRLRVLLGRRLGVAAQQLEGEAVGDPLVVARLQHLLGVVLRELGDLRQAEAVLAKARQTRERLLGADNPDTLHTSEALGVVYGARGKYDLAEALLGEVLKARSAGREAGHPDTLASKNNLGLVYLARGKYDLAEALLDEVLKARSSTLGSGHPDTLASKNNLGLVYLARGKYGPAEALLGAVLKARTTGLRADHPDTLQSKHNLARLYQVQKINYRLAEALYQGALEVRSTTLGPGHPDTLASKNNLALLYQDQRKYLEAKSLLEGAVKVGTAGLGPAHPTTLRSQGNLAGVYRDQGKRAQAETLYWEVLEAQTTELGRDHPDTLQTRYNLAVLYSSWGKLDRSIPLLEEVLDRSTAVFGPDHPDALRAQARLGDNYCHAGRSADGIKLLEDAHRKAGPYPQLAKLGSDFLLLAYVEGGKKKEAITLVAEQVEAARKEVPPGSLRLAITLANAGKRLLRVKADAEAEKLLGECLSIREKQAPDSWEAHDARSHLGAALLGQAKYAEAESLLVAAYEGLKKSASDQKQPITGSSATSSRYAVLEWLVRLYSAWDKPDEAARWRKVLRDEKTRGKD